MHRIIDKRATGKTMRLIMLAKESGASIACGNPAGMRSKALNYGIIGVDFITYQQAIEKGHRDNILIDELENFARYCLNNNTLKGYSLSNED